MFSSKCLSQIVKYLLCLVLLIPLLFYGCDSQDITLSVLVGKTERERGYWQPILESLYSVYPKIKVKFEAGSDNTDALREAYVEEFCKIQYVEQSCKTLKKQVSPQGKSEKPKYDIVYMDVVRTAEFAKNHWIQPLDIPLRSLEPFLESEIEAGRYGKEQKLYRLPFITDVGLLYYRQDLLTDSEDSEDTRLPVPQTFQDLLSTAENLKNQGKSDWGFAWQGAEYEGLVVNFLELLAEGDGFWIDPETNEVGLNEKQSIAAAERLLEIKQKISPGDVTNFREEESRKFFDGEFPDDGKSEEQRINDHEEPKGAAFLRHWPSAWVLMQEEDNSTLINRIAMTPMMGGGVRGGWGFGIANGIDQGTDTVHYEAALKVIKFFTDEISQLKMVSQSGFLPTIKTLYTKLSTDAEIITQYPYFELDLITLLNSADSRPSIPQYQQASKILQQCLYAMLEGKIEPEEAMENAEQATNNLLSTQEYKADLDKAACPLA